MQVKSIFDNDENDIFMTLEDSGEGKVLITLEDMPNNAVIHYRVNVEELKLCLRKLYCK